MKASYNWLKEFVDFSMPPKDLAHALTMSGFEVEGMEAADGDTLLDINVTPNRPDCLSIIGIAREISAVLEIPLKNISVEIEKQEGRAPDIEIKDTSHCQRYASRLIHGVKVAPSPEWLSKRLEAHGFKSISNVVDVTNYVLLEMGQPLHAFDLDKLAGKKIVVDTAGSETKFQTLDNEERIITKDMLFIRDADRPVALAGIMGGLNTEVSSSTVNILLESAYFHPPSIRRTSKSLNLTTESSYRFERGIDINGVTEALDRAAQLIAGIAGGQISGLTDIYNKPYVPVRIKVHPEKINSILGIKIKEAFIIKILNNLGLEIERGGEGFIVTPPSFRQDLQRDVDIIEEIARHYGYDKIPTSLPNIKMRPAPQNKRHDIINIIKNSMTKAGFTEVINYSFFNTDSMVKLNIPTDDKRRNPVLIKNPLRKEETAMRTSLIPSILNNINLNLNRGEKGLSFFEVSKVFLPSDYKLPHEVAQMAAIYNKDMTPALWGDKHDGFYYLKGVLENLFRDLKVKKYFFEPDTSSVDPYLHPGKSCSLIVDGEKIGSLGTMHPKVLHDFDIKGNLTLLEIINIDKLIEHMSTRTSFTSLPKYPYVERDVAIVVSKNITFEQARRVILSVDSALIETVTLFDIYTGKPIPEDKKSLAFSIRYRAGDKTLTDEEVDSLHTVITKIIINTLKAELRS